MDAPPLSQHTLPELPSDLRERNLRAEFVQAYGGRTLLALAVVGTLFLLPFSISSIAEGRLLLGGATLLVAFSLVAYAAAIAAGRKRPIPMVFLFGPALAALVIAMAQLGLVGILWAYAAILLFHFALPRTSANLFNGTIVLVAIGIAWRQLGPDLTVRVGVTLALVLLFTNIFSYVAEAQRRKEAEQRHRLDLLVRGTNAGTLEWDAGGRMHYSRRLREMLGRDLDPRGTRWDFLEFVHADDRKRVQSHMLEQFEAKAAPRSVLHQAPDDFRLLHASGDTVWVHTEGIVVTDAQGRAGRTLTSFMDISDRVRAQEQLTRSHEQVRAQAMRLAAQNGALREAMRLREEVERIGRHDLKTPLASIASVPRLLREGMTLDARSEELLAMVEGAATRVLSMVNLSLDLYRMEEGSYRLRPQPVDLQALLRTLAHELQGHADSKRVRIALELPPQRAVVEGEELLCYSTLANLLKNAVEASPEGGSVNVALRPGHWQEAEAWIVRIHNAGAVPRAIRGQFFAKYATHGKAGGSGLGAYSARLMARVQHGELRMETDDGMGTTLRLWLPASLRALPQDGTGGADPAAVPDEATPLPALSVLVVDDDPYNILVVKNQLPAPPLALESAINGRAALERVRARRFDVVLLDLQMPVMGGLEALGAIRLWQAERGEAPSRLIAFSARDDETSRTECLDAGFDAYLVKPASRGELLALIREAAPVAPVTSADVDVALEPTGPPDTDADRLQGLLPAFVASRQRLLAAMQVAAQLGQRESVRVTAHTLAGSFALYGFGGVAKASRAIERDAGTIGLDDLQARCAALVAQFAAEQAGAGAGALTH